MVVTGHVFVAFKEIELAFAFLQSFGNVRVSRLEKS